MQPTFILTRTFAICGLLVGAASVAQAAPVRASPRSEVEIRNPTPLFPVFITDAIATVADTVKRSAYLGACGAGCTREKVEVKRAPEPKPWFGACFMGCKRSPAPAQDPQPAHPVLAPKPRRWMGACFFGCKRDPEPEVETAPKPKRWVGACALGCKREPTPEPKPIPEPAPVAEPKPFMGACRMGCRRGAEERRDILDVTLKMFKPEAHAPLDVLAREHEPST